MTKRPRDYRAEYARRVSRGLSHGLSRSQARGHPKPTEPTIRPARASPTYNRQLEAGLRVLKTGRSLTESARAAHVSPERLRHYIAQTGFVERSGRRWIIGPDRRHRQMPLYSRGDRLTVTVDVATASEIGEYMAAVGKFINTNNPLFLESFVGRSVKDVRGRRYPLETDRNALYRLEETDPASFEQIYSLVN